jgi:hypothetical protein
MLPVQLLRQSLSMDVLHLTELWAVMFTRWMDSYTRQQIGSSEIFSEGCGSRPSVLPSGIGGGHVCMSLDWSCLTHGHLLHSELAPIYTDCGIPLSVLHILMEYWCYDGAHCTFNLHGTLHDIFGYNVCGMSYLLAFLQSIELPKSIYILIFYVILSSDQPHLFYWDAEIIVWDFVFSWWRVWRWQWRRYAPQMLVDFYNTTWCIIPEGCYLQILVCFYGMVCGRPVYSMHFFITFYCRL